MITLTNTLEKIERTIVSCRNPEQLKVAQRMVDLFKKYNKKNHKYLMEKVDEQRKAISLSLTVKS